MRNESNESYVWLRVKLTADMHRRLKVLAAQRGDTLQGVVVAMLGLGETPGRMRAVPVEVVPDKPKVSTSAYTR